MAAAATAAKGRDSAARDSAARESEVNAAELEDLAEDVGPVPQEVIDAARLACSIHI